VYLQMIIHLVNCLGRMRATELCKTFLITALGYQSVDGIVNLFD
jgi:hypothetical protein